MACLSGLESSKPHLVDLCVFWDWIPASDVWPYFSLFGSDFQRREVLYFSSHRSEWGLNVHGKTSGTIIPHSQFNSGLEHELIQELFCSSSIQLGTLNHIFVFSSSYICNPARASILQIPLPIAIEPLSSHKWLFRPFLFNYSGFSLNSESIPISPYAMCFWHNASNLKDPQKMPDHWRMFEASSLAVC